MDTQNIAEANQRTTAANTYVISAEQQTKYANIKAMKAKIKDMANYQIVLKNQRKAVHLKGKRLISPHLASAEHVANRFKLRHYYLAYAILRGKLEVPTVEQYYTMSEGTSPIYSTMLEKILKKYGL